ncbi:MAG: SDR family NAD(P)-dependent oxidoreductase, partial [Acidobacteria bacterium]|nr:SDR family NAD(P)-dependent oxidoreductase [Acidobacteriota bacterium]
IIKDREGLGEKIAGILKGHGTPVIEVEVLPGAGFRELAGNKYQVSGRQEDYENMLTAVGKFRQVIHLQSINFQDTENTESINPAAKLEKQLEYGVYSLFYLVRALQSHAGRPGRTVGTGSIDILLISNSVHEVTQLERCLHPGNATLFGLGKVVNMEDINLRCRAVDIDEETGLENLITEINAGYSDYKVAYRNGKRYVEELTTAVLPGINGIDGINGVDGGSSHNPENNSHGLIIQAQGVYIITGGTGGLGLEMAGCLAGHGSCHIALISRSTMPERSQWPSIKNNAGNLAENDLLKKIRAVEEIEKKGASVLCCKADVTNREEIENLLNYLRKQYGRINGIIHCAAIGVGQAGKLIKEDNLDIFRRVMAPKIQGTWLLDYFTRQDKPDFFVVFSSSITLMGGMGSGSYTAANTYLDAFASYRHKAGFHTTAMCWAAWAETLKKLQITGFNKNKHLFHIQSTREILQTFARILAGDNNVPVVITGRLNYKSEIFHLGNRLPFRLSPTLQEQVKKYREQTAKEPISAAAREIVPIRLKGRENNYYSQFEQQIARFFGEYLGYNEININDNFYELGGDSIIASKIVWAANACPGVNLVLEDILRYPTIKDLAHQLEMKNTGTCRSNSPVATPLPGTGPAGSNGDFLTIPPVEKKDYYPISDFQEAIFTLSQLKGSKSIGTAYNLPSALLIEGEIDREQIPGIFQQLVDRHETLRTSFCYVGKKPVQRIQDKVAISMDYIEAEPGKDIASLIKEFIKPFDLGRAPLLNVRLASLEAGTSRYLLLIDIHHITADGQSGVNLIKDFCDLYAQKKPGPLTIQFKDYLEWFSSSLNKPMLAKQEKYWLDVFSNGVPELHMPLDYPRPWLQSFKGASVCFESSEKLAKDLNEMAAQNTATLFMVLLAALNKLLFAYTGDEDIVVGAAAAGRRHHQLEPLVGSFINILALKNSPGIQKSFKELLEHVKTNLLQAFENQDYPFGQLARKLDTWKQLGRNPICDVLLVLQNQDRVAMEVNGVTFVPQPVEIDALDIDLNFNIKEKNNRLFIRLEYCPRLYKQETASALLADYTDILETISQKSTLP